MQKRIVDILGVPMDFGVTELGLKIGPDAFREVGVMQMLRTAGFTAHDLGNLPIRLHEEDAADPAGQNLRSIAHCSEVIAERVARSAAASHLPVCLGGDHSLAIGSVSGMMRARKNIGCIWIDAHPDANTPETSPSGNVHGMPVAVLLGHGPESLVGLTPAGAKVRYERMVVLGARDIDPPEIQFLNRHGVRMYTVFDVLEQGVKRILDETIERASAGAEGVHVSLDLDALRDDIAPGVGLRSSCGFDMREISYICEQIASRCNVLSIDIVGLNPVRDVAHRTAMIGVELLTCLLGCHLSSSYYAYLHQQQRATSLQTRP